MKWARCSTLTESIWIRCSRRSTRRRWRMSVPPPGLGSVKPCAASVIRRACATESEVASSPIACGEPPWRCTLTEGYDKNRPGRLRPMALGFVRPARPEDAAEIARIQLSTWRTAYRRMFPAHVLANLDEDYLARGWTEAITAPPSGRHRVLIAIEQAEAGNARSASRPAARPTSRRWPRRNRRSATTSRRSPTCWSSRAGAAAGTAAGCWRPPSTCGARTASRARWPGRTTPTTR